MEEYKKYKLIRVVYEKIKKEYDEYLDKIKSLSIEEIIDKSYEITIKNELCEMFSGKCDDIFNRHIKYDEWEMKALLELDNILDSLYDDWMDADGGIHLILEEQADDYISELGENYREKYIDIIKESPDYELIKMLNDVLDEYYELDFCDDVKEKYKLPQFDIVEVNRILNSDGGVKYLYDFLNNLQDKESFKHFISGLVANEDNYINMKEIIMPKLKEKLLEESRNKKVKNNIQER